PEIRHIATIFRRFVDRWGDGAVAFIAPRSNSRRRWWRRNIATSPRIKLIAEVIHRGAGSSGIRPGAGHHGIVKFILVQDHQALWALQRHGLLFSGHDGVSI